MRVFSSSCTSSPPWLRLAGLEDYQHWGSIFDLLATLSDDNHPFVSLTHRDNSGLSIDSSVAFTLVMGYGHQGHLSVARYRSPPSTGP